MFMIPTSTVVLGSHLMLCLGGLIGEMNGHSSQRDPVFREREVMLCLSSLLMCVSSLLLFKDYRMHN